MDTELWKVYPQDVRYEVSTEGRVRTVDTGRLRKPVKIRSGYLTLVFSTSTKHVLRYVHTMVAETWIGDRPQGLEVSHLDGNKNNCKLDNLAYETHLENHAHRYEHGTDHAGETNPAAKLTVEDIDNIRESTLSELALARIYPVSRTQIGRIRRMENWR